MNFWSLLILILVVAGVYLYLNQDTSPNLTAADESYCAEYYEKIAQPDYIGDYVERIDAVSHGCIE